jgi:hypothetical protein
MEAINDKTDAIKIKASKVINAKQDVCTYPREIEL